MKEYKLSEITLLVTDGKHGDCDDEINSGYYFLSSKDLRDGKLQYDDPREIKFHQFQETHRRTNLKSGDVLLANCGASIGRVGIAQKDPRIEQTTFQKSISVIKANPQYLDSRYLYYFMFRNSSYLEDLGGGTAQPNLLISDIKRIKLKIPSIAIQRKIAAILTNYDDLIETNKQRIATLEKMAEELYKEWFVRLRFPDYKKVTIEKGVPEGWSIKVIGDLVDFLSGYSFKSETYIPYGEYGIVTIKNVQDGHFVTECTDYINDTPSNMKAHCHLQRGDVLMSLTGNVGRVCRVYGEKYLLNQRVAKIKSKIPSSTQFIYYTFKNDSMVQLVENLSLGSTAQMNLSPIQLSKQKILVPTKNLLKNYEDVCEPIQNKILSLLEVNEILVKTRDQLLNRLMGGKIDVDKLDIKFPPSMLEDEVPNA